MDCADPPDISHATWDIVRYSRGRQAVYKCMIGYELHHGYLVKYCDDMGRWYGKNPVCVGK
jgi:hypothetical protein